MSQAQAAAAAERLPWLEDEPMLQPKTKPERRGVSREVLGWAAAGTLLVAGASYWMGVHSSRQPATGTKAIAPSTNVPVPRAQIAEPAQTALPEVPVETAPQVSPPPLREVPILRPRSERRSLGRPAINGSKRAPAQPPSAPREAAAPTAGEGTAQPAKGITSPDAKPLTVWPATRSQGAAGRIVRIGAFGTREQAKLGWRYMVRAYPGVAHLKATVVSDRNSRGRYFYRFQIGTTSQAHSEVLCQRMRRIHLSCAVVGLPWKPSGVER